MTNYSRNNTAGTVATLIYVAISMLLAIFIVFDLTVPAQQGEGIMINFGNSETGFGSEDLAYNPDVSASVSRPARPAVSDREFVTQDMEDAPEIPKNAAPKPNPTPSTATQPVEKPRTVDSRALFPGLTQGSSSTSEGVAGGTGNQGNLAGAVDGSHSGTGTGTGGNSYSLSGRSLMGSLPKPDYAAREEGRVIIEIKVNQQGEVISTSFRSVGSTTTNNVLVSAAQRAAKLAKFNVDENAPFPQVGTITYNFRMN